MVYTMDSREVVKALRIDGWYKIGQVGSHLQLRHPAKKGRVTVPHPKRDLHPGVIKPIEKQSGIRLR